MRSKGLNIKVPRLGVNRFGVFYVRSSTLDATGRRKVIQYSLGTKDPLLAKAFALRFNLALVSEELMSDLWKHIQTYELDLEKGVAKAADKDDHARMMEAMEGLQRGRREEAALRNYDLAAVLAKHLPSPVAQPPQLGSVPQAALGSASSADAVALAAHMASQHLANLPKPTDAGKKLRQALDDHLVEETKRVKSARTVQEKRALFSEFVDFFGDVYLNQVTRLDISERWRKAELARKNQKRVNEQLSPGRLEKRRGYLMKFFDWAAESGYYMHPENPMAQKMAGKKEIRQATQSYKEYTTGDLQLLFGSTFPIEMDKPDWYWVPLMALYSGARLGELVSLTTKVFEDVDGVKIFYIADSKTPGGRRTVPIHSQLLTLGVWDYVNFLRSKGETQLFWYRPPGKLSKSAGDMWAKWVQRCGITDQSKVFHSFRSTVITSMHNGPAPNAAAIRSSVGHIGSVGGSHGGYIRGSELHNVQATIESVVYPSVNTAQLRLSDPTFTHFYSTEKARLTSPGYADQQERRKRHAALRAERADRIRRRSM